MDGGSDQRRERRLYERGALRGDLELGADDRLRRRRSEADDCARLDDLNLRLQPRTAGVDLPGVRLLVDAALAARLPLEVLDDVGDVDPRPVDARFDQRLVEQSAGGTDERAANEILAVARLLADEHHGRSLPPFAEHRLRAGLPEIAGLAAGRDRLQLLDRRPRRDQR